MTVHELQYQVINNLDEPVKLESSDRKYSMIAEVRVNNQPYKLCKLSKHLAVLDNSNVPVAKTCGGCNRMLTLSSFYRDTQGSFNRTSTCADCRKVANRQYRESHKEYFREYQLKHREQLLLYRKKWLADNQHKVQLYSARGALKRQQAMQNCLPDDIEYLTAMENSEPACVITGVTANTEMDHVLPVTKGNWGNNRGNLLWLYAPLNVSKGNSNIFNWIEQMSQERLNYLLPESIALTVEQFQAKFKEALTAKAVEQELTFEQYKQKYTDSFQTD